jgi:hypothetical protein
LLSQPGFDGDYRVPDSAEHIINRSAQQRRSIVVDHRESCMCLESNAEAILDIRLVTASTLLRGKDGGSLKHPVQVCITRGDVSCEVGLHLHVCGQREAGSQPRTDEEVQVFALKQRRDERLNVATGRQRFSWCPPALPKSEQVLGLQVL